MEDNLKGKRLYRSNRDKYMAGVAGGIAEFFGIDSTIIRILFVLFTFFGGMGLVIYIAALLLVPTNPNHEEEVQENKPTDKNTFWAIVLISAGIFLLFRAFGLFSFHFGAIPWSIIWALLLIGAGLYLILSHNKQKSVDSQGDATNQTDETAYNNLFGKRFFRSRDNRMIAGICGGIAEYFNIDVSIIRLLFVFFTFFSVGTLLLMYLILIFVIPEKEV